ncbi:Uncharacterised protein [uncultured Eubacterium sp.]|uniref:DUF4363 family protein n=1 Tax=Emergencia sp. TaxID=1926557 RepID=UPI000822FA37|nr:Uncharacterised protein [uncultured Eubacterium sp.]
MRSLLISILSLAVLVGCWGIFYYSAGQDLDQIISDCEEIVMPAIEDEDWDKAYSAFQTQYDRWHDYRKGALFFLDTQAVNEADSTFAKTLMYIKAEDVSNGSGELLALKEQLKFLHENEKISFENIL